MSTIDNAVMSEGNFSFLSDSSHHQKESSSDQTNSSTSHNIFPVVRHELRPCKKRTRKKLYFFKQFSDRYRMLTVYLQRPGRSEKFLPDKQEHPGYSSCFDFALYSFLCRLNTVLLRLKTLLSIFTVCSGERKGQQAESFMLFSSLTNQSRINQHLNSNPSQRVDFT